MSKNSKNLPFLPISFPIYRANLEDDQYPKLLKQIHRPPEAIYYQGRLHNNLFPIAIVGSRKMTPYGLNAVNKIVSALSGLPIIIISGLAYGVDAAVHQAALDNNIKTLAVLGNSLEDRIYPASNIPLANKILASGGGLVSELNGDFPLQKMNFPMRNRIISGISECVIVIEADLDSGSLITADFAIEQNRDLFALPGSIFSRYSAGTNNLLKSHAYLIDSAEDILNKYPQILKLRENFS